MNIGKKKKKVRKEKKKIRQKKKEDINQDVEMKRLENYAADGR